MVITKVAAKEDITACMALLSTAEDAVTEATQKTARQFAEFQAAILQRLDLIAQENTQLQLQVMKAESGLRECKCVQQGELGALQAEERSVAMELAAIRRQMGAIQAQGDQRIAAERTAREEAVRVATQAGEARLVVARQAVDAKVAAHAQGKWAGQYRGRALEGFDGLTRIINVAMLIENDIQRYHRKEPCSLTHVTAAQQFQRNVSMLEGSFNGCYLTGLVRFLREVS